MVLEDDLLRWQNDLFDESRLEKPLIIFFVVRVVVSIEGEEESDEDIGEKVEGGEVEVE